VLGGLILARDFDRLAERQKESSEVIKATKQQLGSEDLSLIIFFFKSLESGVGWWCVTGQ
jgi:hypothetical protein